VTDVQGITLENRKKMFGRKRKSAVAGRRGEGGSWKGEIRTHLLLKAGKVGRRLFDQKEWDKSRRDPGCGGKGKTTEVGSAFTRGGGDLEKSTFGRFYP